MRMIVILEDLDLEALSKGEVVKIEDRHGEIIGLVTRKFLEDETEEI